MAYNVSITCKGHLETVEIEMAENWNWKAETENWTLIGFTACRLIMYPLLVSVF